MSVKLSSFLCASDKKPMIAVASASQSEVMLACEAVRLGLASFCLFGDKRKIHGFFQENQLPFDSITVIDEPDPASCARLAVGMVKSGEADIPMKGFVQTSDFFRAVLDKNNGLPHGRLSQVCVFEHGGGLRMLTDTAINITPDIACMKHIIENAAELAVRLGISKPKIALLAAVETINHAMPETLNCAVLTQMNKRGQIKGCVIDGPLALDNAVSPEAAALKGIAGPVAGNADILVAPNLLVGNVLGKALVYYAGLRCAYLTVGIETPIIATSRTENTENRLLSIAAACRLK